MFSEKRQYPRGSLNLPIKLSNLDPDLVTETKNISANGAYCAVNKELAPMTKLNITLLIPIKKNNRKTLKRVDCKGVVVRNEPLETTGKHTHNVGIYFNDIKDADRRVIMSYVDSSSTR